MSGSENEQNEHLSGEEEPQEEEPQEDEAQEEEAEQNKEEEEEPQEDEEEQLDDSHQVNKSNVSFAEPLKSATNLDKEPSQKLPKMDMNVNGKQDQSSISNPILAKNKPPKPQPPKEYELFDFIFPGGKLSKLCKFKNIKNMATQIPMILEAFNLKEAVPCLILAGARDNQRGKLLAGIARAAFRSDAVILDSGVASGIETYCLRRSKHL